GEGPALLTTIVYVRVTPSPAVTVVTPSVFVIVNSARSTVVVAVAVLSVLSLGEETVALFVMLPTVFGAVTVIVIGGASPAPAPTLWPRLPPVRLHVTVPDTLTQFQFDGAVALTKVVPAGSVSTTLTAEA